MLVVLVFVSTPRHAIHQQTPPPPTGTRIRRRCGTMLRAQNVPTRKTTKHASSGDAWQRHMLTRHHRYQGSNRGHRFSLQPWESEWSSQRSSGRIDTENFDEGMDAHGLKTYPIQDKDSGQQDIAQQANNKGPEAEEHDDDSFAERIQMD